MVLTFGISYSSLLLDIYGGKVLRDDDGLAVSLLRSHCVFVVFLALNGVTECYAFNVMTTEQLSKYNYVMTVMTVCFLAATYVFAKAFGPVGFVLANCSNFAMRIAHNFYVITKRHENAEVKPTRGLLPPLVVLTVLAISAGVTLSSERIIYQAGSLKASIIHLGIGAISFVISLIVIALKDPLVSSVVMEKFGRMKSRKKAD